MGRKEEGWRKSKRAVNRKKGRKKEYEEKPRKTKKSRKRLNKLEERNEIKDRKKGGEICKRGKLLR